jgi:hypothetical protein
VEDYGDLTVENSHTVGSLHWVVLILARCLTRNLTAGT